MLTIRKLYRSYSQNWKKQLVTSNQQKVELRALRVQANLLTDQLDAVPVVLSQHETMASEMCAAAKETADERVREMADQLAQALASAEVRHKRHLQECEMAAGSRTMQREATITREVSARHATLTSLQATILNTQLQPKQQATLANELHVKLHDASSIQGAQNAEILRLHTALERVRRENNVLMDKLVNVEQSHKD